MRKHAVPFIALGFALWWGSTRNYLLFHALAEIWSVVIACLIGFLGLAVPRRERNPLAAGLGVLFLAVAGIDILHTLAFKGMGIFAGLSANPSIQFWILARTLETSGLLSTVLFHRKKTFFPAFTSGVALYFLAGLALVFSGKFPDCYLPGTGLTPFKIGTEWILCGALLFSVPRSSFGRKIQPSAPTDGPLPSAFF